MESENCLICLQPLIESPYIDLSSICCRIKIHLLCLEQSRLRLGRKCPHCRHPIRKSQLDAVDVAIPENILNNQEPENVNDIEPEVQQDADIIIRENNNPPQNDIVQAGQEAPVNVLNENITDYLQEANFLREQQRDLLHVMDAFIENVNFVGPNMDVFDNAIMTDLLNERDALRDQLNLVNERDALRDRVNLLNERLHLLNEQEALRDQLRELEAEDIADIEAELEAEDIADIEAANDGNNQDNGEEDMVIPVEPMDQNNEIPDSENDEIPDFDRIGSSDDDNEDFDGLTNSDDDSDYHPTQHF